LAAICFLDLYVFNFLFRLVAKCCAQFIIVIIIILFFRAPFMAAWLSKFI